MVGKKTKMQRPTRPLSLPLKPIHTQRVVYQRPSHMLSDTRDTGETLRERVSKFKRTRVMFRASLSRKCHGLLWPSLSCAHSIYHVKPTSSEDQALTHLHSCLSRLLHFHANQSPPQDVTDSSQILWRTPKSAVKTKGTGSKHHTTDGKTASLEGHEDESSNVLSLTLKHARGPKPRHIALQVTRTSLHSI